MAQDEFKKLNIAISAVEDTGPQIKLRDQNKRTYSFFKTKKDGGETVAFQDYKNFKPGDTAEITYKEVPYKEGTIKNIIGIHPASGEPETPAPPAKSLASYKPGKTDREYWEAREANRQSSILFQVAFKSAAALEAARVRAGQDEDLTRMYDQTLDFYDFMAGQIGDGDKTSNVGPEVLSDEENLGF